MLELACTSADLAGQSTLKPPAQADPTTYEQPPAAPYGIEGYDYNSGVYDPYGCVLLSPLQPLHPCPLCLPIFLCASPVFIPLHVCLCSFHCISVLAAARAFVFCHPKHHFFCQANFELRCTVHSTKRNSISVLFGRASGK